MANGKAVLPPIQPDVNFINRGREVERMLTESRQSIATSVQRLVEHAGRVQGQIESELGSFRTVGQAYMKLSKESNELNDRCVTNESSIDVTTRELAAQNKLVLELNARIGDMQRELAEEKSNRIGLESQLQDAVQCNERDRAEFQEQLRLAREQSQNELHSLREQSMSEAQDLQNAHKAEVDEMHQKHTAESLQQTNSFKSLEKRLDNVAQNHEKQITMARNEAAQLKSEVDVLAPRASALQEEVSRKEEEIKKLVAALQKAHSVGEVAKKDLLTERNEVKTLKDTLRKALEATEKSQKDLKGERELSAKLQKELSASETLLADVRGGLTEEQEEVLRLRQACNSIQMETDMKMAKQQEKHDANYLASQNELEGAQQVHAEQVNALNRRIDELSGTLKAAQTEVEAKDSVLQAKESEIKSMESEFAAKLSTKQTELEAKDKELQNKQAELEQALMPKKRLSMLLQNNGTPLFTRQSQQIPMTPDAQYA